MSHIEEFDAYIQDLAQAYRTNNEGHAQVVAANITMNLAPVTCYSAADGISVPPQFLDVISAETLIATGFHNYDFTYIGYGLDAAQAAIPAFKEWLKSQP